MKKAESGIDTAWESVLSDGKASNLDGNQEAHDSIVSYIIQNLSKERDETQILDHARSEKDNSIWVEKKKLSS